MGFGLVIKFSLFIDLSNIKIVNKFGIKKAIFRLKVISQLVYYKIN